MVIAVHTKFSINLQHYIRITIKKSRYKRPPPVWEHLFWKKMSIFLFWPVYIALLPFVTTLKVEKTASQYDQTWMKELCIYLMGLFVFINCVFIIPIALDAPHVIFLVVRVLFGVLIALYNHILKGFTLYEHLTEAERE